VAHMRPWVQTSVPPKKQTNKKTPHKLEILQPQPPEFWNYRSEQLHPAFMAPNTTVILSSFGRLWWTTLAEDLPEITLR
jgi:hypothetical protein